MRIYFSGIGGVGIGPLAQIALDAGYEVIGSDVNHSLVTAELEKRGIEIAYEQDGVFLQAQQPIDWFVYTSALPDDHPELMLARKLGVRTAKRDELLAHIIAEKNLKLIAVAGTHGKTTTTGMLVWTLQQLGLPVSYSVGTTLSWGPSGKFDPTSEYFVYECDEFDRNFLHFSPFLSLITSIEWDHPDTYPTEDQYFSAFSQFCTQSQQVIMWHTDAKKVAPPQNSWLLQPSDVFDIKLAGAHNRRNGTLVLKAVESLQQDASSVKTHLPAFPGVNRRFEKLAGNLYTDYGHTPAEIKATLQLARELSDHVVLAYQPHQNVRQHEIHSQYTSEIFADAEQIFWLPTYLSRENPELKILSPQTLAKNLDSSKLHIASLDDQLWSEIQNARSTGKLVLIMGAGDIDSWVRKYI